MIGDWVIAQPDEDICGEGIGTIVDRITEIYDVEGVMSVSLDDFDYPVAVGLLEPLRMTEEMLEKNLATFQPISWCIGWNKPDDIHIEIKNEDLIGSFYGTCNYVHELQHALRLCKFDKQADDFKL